MVPGASRVRRALAYGGTLLVVVAVVVASAVVMGPAPRPTGGNAAAYFPVDGASVVVEPGQQHSWARVDGSGVLFGPIEVVYAFLGEEFDLARFSSREWLREQSTDVLGQQQHTFYSIDESGLRRHVMGRGQDIRAYPGGFLEIPADVADGATWRSEGEWVTLTESGHYRIDGRAEAVEDCLRITLHEDDGSDDPRTSSRLWCRDGRAVLDESMTVMDLEDQPWADMPVDLTNYESWELSEPTRTRGGQAVVVDNPIAPTGTDGMTIGSRLTGDMQIHEDQDGKWEMTGWMHPGGHLLDSVQVGNRTVVATTQRLVAYTPSRWTAWSVDSQEHVASMAAVGGNTVVTVDRGGTVVQRGIIDGRVQWWRQWTSAHMLPVRSCGSSVAVLSDPREVSVIGDSGEIRATMHMVHAVRGFGCTDDAVLVVDELGSLSLFDRTGARLWTGPSGTTGTVRAVEAAGERFVIATTEETLVVRVSDGTVEERFPEALALTGDGLRAVAVTGQEVVLVDGTARRRWPIAHRITASDVGCTALQRRVVCVASDNRVLVLR